VLHLEEIPNTASNSSTRWMSLNEGKALHLIPRPNLDVKINKAVHFALCTDNLDAVLKTLNERKIEFSDWVDVPNNVYVRKDGMRQIYFQDPDGYWIEVNDDVL